MTNSFRMMGGYMIPFGLLKAAEFVSKLYLLVINFMSSVTYYALFKDKEIQLIGICQSFIKFDGGNDRKNAVREKWSSVTANYEKFLIQHSSTSPTSMQKFERPVAFKATGRSNFCIEVNIL